jgi:hypothetical protein
VRLKANISRDRRRFDRRSVGEARFTALPQETLPKGGPVSSPLENTLSECIPNRRESKVADPHRELNQLQCGPPYCKLPVVTLAGLPMASPDTRSSTLRFCWRPAELSLEATGSVLPKPLALTEFVVTPSRTR